jgi:hypothetical protein
VTKLVVPYAPRDCYKAFHRANKRFTQLVAHRRSGKTYSMLAEGVKRALTGPDGALYHYCAPYYGQAKAIAWDILTHLTADIAARGSEVELWKELPNQSRIRLFGADRPDAMRGLRCHGLLADEYADWSDAVYQEIHQPMLADTRGWAIFGGTPKGRNHFHDQRERAVADDLWHTELLPVSLTKLIPDEELAYLKTTMSPEVYAQEFECSFVAPRTGSYYGELVERARIKGRIGEFAYNPELPVEIATDLGYTDSTAAWYWQTGPDGYAIVDYDEFAGRELSWWIRLWMSKGYKYEKIWLPHDARAKSFQTGRSVLEQCLAHDLPVEICPELGVQDGIEAVRLQFDRWHFDHQNTALGLKRLSNYRRSWNAKTKAYAQKPLHDESSDGADAARYMALVQREHKSQLVVDKPAATGVDRRFQLDVLFEDRESYTQNRGASGMG